MATPLSIDTSNAALASRYDEISYEALPHPETHPDRLATVATLVGHVAPHVDRCSVLEVGCNDGANLIPMAVSLPNAHFVGWDLSPRALDAGRRTISALGLTNVALFEGDLTTLATAHREFDFIVAHGVYSWVPPNVRDALFALAAERLAPNGILYVSFNVLPGCRVRQAAWDVLHHHVDHIESARARLDAARQLANLIADGGTAACESDQALRAEFRAIAQHSDSELCHDDLAVPNEPVLFHSFVQHAARHGLRYLAEAEFGTMGVEGVSNDAKGYLSTLDPLAREQYLDFVRLRRFRQSLVVRDDSLTVATQHSSRVRAMHVSASPELVRAAATGGIHKLARRLDPAAGGGGPVRKLLDAIVADQPATYEIASLDGHLDLRSLSRPLENILADASAWGIVDLHVQPRLLTIRPSERPVASPLARLQARTSDVVTTLLHVPVRIADTNALRLLPLVDGTRDRAALAAAVKHIAFNIESSRAGDFVNFALEKFARLGLLMPDTHASERSLR
jgi:protein-L-isoaspartate O-methyltransferase